MSESAFSVQQTSLEAYDSIRESLGERQRTVLDMLRRAGPTNNRLLAEALGWPVNRVTPRVLELREAGLVFEHGVQRDPATGRSATVWSTKPADSGKEGR